MAGESPKTDGGTWSEQWHSDPKNPWFSYMGTESAFLQIDGELFGQYGWNTKGDVGVTGHNASLRFRNHHYSTFSHVNSWAPIDGGPQCSGEPGCAFNLSMNVWEHTPLDLGFLQGQSLPISPAYLAEAKRTTIVVDGKLCSATKTVYDYIGDHLGYRFELTRAMFVPIHPRSSPFVFEAAIVNRGFSAMHNPRPVFLVLIQQEKLVFRSRIDASPGDWQPFTPGDPSFAPIEHELAHTISDDDLPGAGIYQLGLYMPDLRSLNNVTTGSTALSPLLDHQFCVRLANGDAMG